VILLLERVALVNDQTVIVDIIIKHVLRIALAGDEAMLVPGPGLVASVGLAFPYLHLNFIGVLGFGDIEHHSAVSRHDVSIGGEFPLLVRRALVLPHHNLSTLFLGCALNVSDFAIDARLDVAVLVDPQLISSLAGSGHLVSHAATTASISGLLRVPATLLRIALLLGRISLRSTLRGITLLLLRRITLLRRIALLLGRKPLRSTLLRRIASRRRIAALLRRIALRSTLRG